MMAVLLGLVTGLLSGCGLGGGTLLLLYLLEVQALDQTVAQGVNLLYYLPTVACSLPSHVKGGFVEKTALLPCILGALPLVAVGSFLANSLEEGILRQCFGVLLLCLAVLTWRDSSESSDSKH